MAYFLRYCLIGVLSLTSLNAFALQSFDTVSPSGTSGSASVPGNPHAAQTARTWNKSIDLGNGQKFKFNATETRKYGWNTIKSGIGRMLKTNPGKLAISVVLMASLEAVGYVLDPANNQIQRPEVLPIVGQGILGWSTDYPAYPYVPTASQSCQDRIAADNAGGSLGVYHSIKTLDASGTVGVCRYTIPGYSDIYESYTTSAYGPCITGGTCTGSTISIPVTPAEVDTFVSTLTDKNIATGLALLLEADPELQRFIRLQVWPAHAGDTVATTGPASVNGETTTTTETTPTGTKVTTVSRKYDLTYTPGKTTVKTTTTTTVAEDGLTTSTTVESNPGTAVDNSPESSPSESETPEQLTDCDFMPTVCTFLTWVQEPFTPPTTGDDLPPLTEIPAPSINMSGSSGSCPAPITVNTAFVGSIEVSYQPLCDFAAYLRFLVIGGALMFAIYISMGISRSTN